MHKSRNKTSVIAIHVSLKNILEKYYENVTKYELYRIFDYEIVRNLKINIMKTIIASAFPFIGTLLIAGLIFCAMSFRNPFVAENENKVAQLRDTVPDTQLNVNIDMGKILAEADKAIASIDFDKIMNDVQQSLQKINFEKIQMQVQQSLKQIDYAKMQKDIDASLKNIDWKMVNRNIDSSMKKIDYKKMKQEIEKSMERLHKQMNSKEFRESMQKINEIDMKKINEEMDKAKIEMEKSQEELKKEIQKIKEEKDAKNSSILDNDYGFEKSGFTWI